jgi:hypothetical protein
MRAEEPPAIAFVVRASLNRRIGSFLHISGS